jgi:glycosyltransferase involved in cell wall biosynthesis
MNHEYTIAVIITTYKRDQYYLKRAISSVLNQTFQDWELIVVDDNSSDSKYRIDVENLLNEYSSFENIKYIKYSN